MFLKMSYMPDEVAPEFLVLIWHDLTVCAPSSWYNYFVCLPNRACCRRRGKYAESLPRLLKGDARLALAFELPPPRMDPLCGEEHRDNMFWEAYQVSHDAWKGTGCDLAMKIRRPRRKDASSVPRNVPIVAYSSYHNGQMVGIAADKYYLNFDAGLRVAERRVAACHRVLQGDNLWIPSGDSNKGAMHLYKRDFYCGAGFPTLLTPPV